MFLSVHLCFGCLCVVCNNNTVISVCLSYTNLHSRSSLLTMRQLTGTIRVYVYWSWCEWLICVCCVNLSVCVFVKGLRSSKSLFNCLFYGSRLKNRPFNTKSSSLFSFSDDDLVMKLLATLAAQLSGW